MLKTFKLTLAGVLLLSGTALADQFHFDNPGSVTWGGVYVNPYAGTDTTQNLSVSLYCGDWNTDFSGHPTWNADVYALTANYVPKFKYGSMTQTFNLSLNGSVGHYTVSAGASNNLPDEYHRYLEEAWLDEQTVNDPTNQDKQKEIAAAVWTLFVSGPSNVNTLITDINNSGSTFALDVFNYLTAASDAVTAQNNPYTAPDWYVVVPTSTSLSSYPDGGQQMQEFLIHNFSGTTVPEPSAIVLLGTLLGIFGIAKFRRKHLA